MNNDCKSCWWQEGGLCYVGTPERDENGRSKKPATQRCELYKSKRAVLEPYFVNKITTIREEYKK